MKTVPGDDLTKVVNVSTVPHRSPFRYPGGKTWLVPIIRRWLKSRKAKPVQFIEHFAGGGIVSLSAVFENLAENATLVEMDENVASVWRVMLNGKAKQLAKRIGEFEMNEAAARAALAVEPASLFDRAFVTILRNRVQRGGIMAPGASLMKDGENGRGVGSRWYAQTLMKRIEAISEQKAKFTFIQGDGLKCIAENANRVDAVHFIDPPYTVAGRRLYVHSEVDHEELFRLTSTVKGDFLMTYDDAGPVRELADRFGFQAKTVPMKNTHHAVMKELLIGRDLSWLK